jgi:hypothetical protein
MDDQVRTAFDKFPAPLRERLLMLRALIHRAASETDPMIEIEETLKWGQPSYLPRAPRTGSTVRLGALKAAPSDAVLFFHCQTRLVETFRHLYPDTFGFDGNRAMTIPPDKPVPEDEIRHCVSLALTYHRWK